MKDNSWTEPGAYEVAPGVHRIPLPLPMDGLRAVNVYVMEGASGLTLVDGGWAIPESRKLLEDCLAQIGHRVSDIDRFLVTHMHRDHYTQAYVLGQEVGSHVALGMGDRASMELMQSDDIGDPNAKRLQLAGAAELYARYREMMPKTKPDLSDYGIPDEWMEGDFTIEVGDRNLDALATPGHTQGHYVFADQKGGILFAGDHVLPHITPSIGFEPAWVTQPLRDFLDSLAKMQALPDLRLLPAHGPVCDSVHDRVAELVAFHDVRLAQSLAAVEGGARTTWEVAGELPWRSRGIHRDELDTFDKTLAVFETMAHLELLALRGDVVRSVVEDVALFEPKPA